VAEIESLHFQQAIFFSFGGLALIRGSMFSPAWGVGMFGFGFVRGVVEVKVLICLKKKKP